MKVCISGGHLTPALAVIDYAQARGTGDTFVFAGRLYSQPKLKQRSWEKQEVSKRGVTFVPFSAPKLDGQPWWHLPVVGLKMLRAVWRAYALLGKHKPDVFLSFGGFLAVPLAIAARLRGIPVVTHEQTRVVGVANAWVGKLSHTVAISFPESKQFFPSHNVQLTGNPLRTQLLNTSAKKPSWLPDTLPSKPLLYVTGGNQGSQCINVLVQEGLEALLTDWWVIHQCGSPTTVMNYKKSLEKAQSRLPSALKSDYIIREWVTEEELGWIYAHADGALSRSGANTVTEFMAVGLPAVFIPLPQAHQDEQLLNAQAMADSHAAMILLQKDASVSTLLETLRQLKRKLRSYGRQAKELKDSLPANPTEQLYQIMQQTQK